jgi:hypothetical protein
LRFGLVGRLAGCRMPSPDCPFCAKLTALDRLAGDELVWQFPHSVALLGPWQFYHGYCVLVARRHARELSELPDADRRAYLDEMCLLARAIEAAFRPDKLNYRADADALKPVWLALDRAERDEAERRRLQAGPLDRAETVQRLREHLRLLSAPLA